MSLSSTTLSDLQKAGSAAFAADAKLKAEVKDYSQRVHEAMVANPDGHTNDALFANWKIVSRISQAVSNIEVELKKLFATAAALGSEAITPVVQAFKPAASTKRTAKKAVKAPAKAKSVAAVEVVSAKTLPVKAVKAVKAKAEPKVAVKAKAIAKPKAKTVAKKAKAKATGPVTLGANPTKVLRHLENLLNVNDFTVISQTAVSKETGIPLGSMTAATKKLMETGFLVAGPSGSFKLVHAPTTAQ